MKSLAAIRYARANDIINHTLAFPQERLENPPLLHEWRSQEYAFVYAVQPITLGFSFLFFILTSRLSQDVSRVDPSALLHRGLELSERELPGREFF